MGRPFGDLAVRFLPRLHPNHEEQAADEPSPAISESPSPREVVLAFEDELAVTMEDHGFKHVRSKGIFYRKTPDLFFTVNVQPNRYNRRGGVEVMLDLWFSNKRWTQALFDSGEFKLYGSKLGKIGEKDGDVGWLDISDERAREASLAAVTASLDGSVFPFVESAIDDPAGLAGEAAEGKGVVVLGPDRNCYGLRPDFLARFATKEQQTRYMHLKYRDASPELRAATQRALEALESSEPMPEGESVNQRVTCKTAMSYARFVRDNGLTIEWE